MSAEKLSSYAFNAYGGDAKLYNGIHDLETRIAELEQITAGDQITMARYKRERDAAYVVATARMQTAWDAVRAEAGAAPRPGDAESLALIERHTDGGAA